VFTALYLLYTAKDFLIVVLLPAVMLHRNEWIDLELLLLNIFSYRSYVWNMRGCTCRRVVFILYSLLNYHGNINIVRTLSILQDVCIYGCASKNTVFDWESTKHLVVYICALCLACDDQMILLYKVILNFIPCRTQWPGSYPEIPIPHSAICWTWYRRRGMKFSFVCTQVCSNRMPLH
jgi:hypothetical protein